MKLDKNIIDAIKKTGHDRIIIHSTGVYSCKVTDDAQMGDKATIVRNAAIVYGARNIMHVGDSFITAPYVAFDLREKVTKEQVKEAVKNEQGET